MSLAREEVLRRVRRALSDVGERERPDDVPVERAYRDRVGDGPAALVERFAERVADYRATVRRSAAGEAGAALAAACAEHGVRRLVVPADLPPQWRPAGVELVPDETLSHRRLDRLGAVLTGCALGIAETGTIVLDGGEAQGRRAITLLPDVHLCVVRAEQVVGGVPEALARLAERGPGRPITFVSGPSATSDIELNRVEGVHGPRTLDVLITD